MVTKIATAELSVEPECDTIGNIFSRLNEFRFGSKMYVRLWLMAFGRTIPFGDSNVSLTKLP